MANIVKKNNNNFWVDPSKKPDKVETFAGKETSRVTKTYNQPDGSVVKATVKVNKDLSISKKIEIRS